jgi:hypothetical protein
MKRSGALLMAAALAVLAAPAYGAPEGEPGREPKREEPEQKAAEKKRDKKAERETCPGHRDDPREQVVGTDADDVLFVPEGAIGCGLGGDDLLRADRHGDTRLFGGDGDDVFCAENSDADYVYGGDGEDRARSDEAEDTLRDIEGDTVLIGCAVRR